jgi:nitrate reductase gamma subunit
MSTMPQLAAGLIVLLAPAVAYAYIGPGAGLTALGSLVALVGTVVLAVVGFVWFPIRRLMRARAARASGASENRTSEPKRG